MRKVTQQIVNAFLAGVPCSAGNSHTDGQSIFLHGNKIAEKREGGIYISNAGWSTNTTKERLNGLLDILNKPRIYQKDWSWYWGDKKPFPSNEFVRVA